MEPLPNTYTFAKSLAEHVVNDLFVSTFEDPVAGWIDNFNGPVGLLTAGGKGIIYTL
ncbi:hypothetical protein NQ314_009750 [Rhamnusium bicolor]|uniref:Thioester reductase (TE) domain-containing protein n=1 Tax=Rhamnusium bicolor TaxID=1586634 RepID=A0AAV8XYU2_9CUCU|nr:hypothetical protein NQ314_009750 [Rhamnusium bicolor]